jgi:transposase
VDLLLTLVRQRLLPEHPTPRVLGVDDWAMLKGQRYGTILIDHERGDIVDLLPDRTPERLAQWLREHPGVEIVTRDRAEAYAQGIREGAPDAIQVADRWHLIKNVSDAIASVLQDYRQAINKQLAPPAQTAAPQEGAAPNAVTPPRSTALATPQAAHSTAVSTPADLKRQDRAQEAHDLHARGWSQKEIARQLNCHPRTVRRYLRRALPLAARVGDRRSKLDGYKPYILRRWNEGCHNASQLLREIQAQGFDGRGSIVRAYVAALREMSGVPARSRKAGGQPLAAKATERVPSSRTLAWMSTQEPHTLEEDQRATLEKLGAINPTIKTALELGQAFATMVRQRQADNLDEWLERAAKSGIAALVSVANGMRADAAAVRAGLTLEWSNGRTEGCVNRLKCVTRQMYGRGQLDLLRLRLRAA